MKQNLKFIEIENDVVTIDDVIFDPYHVQYLKKFFEHYSVNCSATQNQLTDDFNHQKFNSIKSLKAHLGLVDEVINVDNFVSKFVAFHKDKISKTIFPSFRLSCAMKLH